MKTRVYKDRFSGYWSTTYYLPYSGVLTAQYLTWEEAYSEASNIERQRVFL